MAEQEDVDDEAVIKKDCPSSDDMHEDHKHKFHKDILSNIGVSKSPGIASAMSE